MKEILIASKNKGKLHEYEALLKPYDLKLRSLFDFPEIAEIEETGDTFEKNALIKAKTLHDLTGLPVIADDSGLMVEALNGEPGIHSKRYSEAATDLENNRLLVKNLSNHANRKATFVAVIAYYENASHYELFRGETVGEIVLEPRAGQGFGYDPHFLIPSLGKALSELTTIEKNQVSHRGKAFAKFIEYWSYKS
jgi:XTP/dITP diphosphohydrolase